MLNVDARQHLNELLPPGMLATKRWLLEQGLSLHFLDNAVRSKTLLLLTPGVFVQFNKSINWQGVVASLQRMSKTPIHVGGLSALQIAGLAQYLSPKVQLIALYAPAPLPKWLTRIPPSASFEGHRTGALWSEKLMQNPAYIKQEQWREGLPPVCFSCPEKAILEVLQGVPNRISFEHADELMQGLYNLSPRKLNELLHACTSIKVKRLFFWLAERHNHAWFKKIAVGSVELGTGKRVIAVGGRLDKIWHITVPQAM